jgi:hypothetical protein
VLDIVALALVLGGAICYGVAFAGLKRLHAAGFVPHGPGNPWVAVDEWIRWRRLSWIGLAIGVLGIAVGVTAAVVAARKKAVIPAP